MADPTIGASGLNPIRPIQPSTTSPIAKPSGLEGKDFKSYMLDSLATVNRLQNEADAGVQKLLTGESDNVAEVLSASRKAGVAFDLLMQIRNKLLDAYNEVRQMRV